MYTSEIYRCLNRVELREQLRLNYDITDEEYRSEHEITGEIRSLVTPDQEVVRARTHPPSNPIYSMVQSLTKSDNTLGEGYPGTNLIAAVTRIPPVTERDEQFQSGFSRQEFTVEGIPENGTITIDGDWTPDQARDSLANDEQKAVSHEYNVEELPSDQLPVVIRATLQRDAREHLESALSTINERDVKKRNRGIDPTEVEGLAVLSIAIEYREDSPERNVAGGDGELYIENFRVEMQSTFPNISFRPREASTYNPEAKRVEWRKRTAEPGETLRYDIFGRMEKLLDLGDITATVRGVISGDTLTGTNIVGLYDRSGTDLIHRDVGQVEVGHGVTVTGDIKIDPAALRNEARKVMDASISLNDTPFDAFERLQTVCNREGMTITTSTEPSDPEPVANREGVLAITKGEKADGDDEPGELEVKREYGDQGVVYAHILVYGRFTPMSQDREVSQSSGTSDQTEDRLVRADEGALGDRGKSTVEIRARSADAELNSEFVQTMQDGLGGGNS